MRHGILQVSSIKIRHDLSEPVSSMVKEVYIGTCPLDPNKTYSITTVDFFAAGGDKFSNFKEGRNLVN